MNENLKELQRLKEQFDKSVLIRKTFGFSDDGVVNVKVIKPVGVSPNDARLDNKLMVEITHGNDNIIVSKRYYDNLFI